MSSYFTAIESVTHPYPKDDAGRTSHPTTCASQAPADILVDGALSYMFGSRISEWYFEHLLKGRIRRSLLRWDVPGWPGACFTSQESGSEIPVFHEQARLLDYDVRRLRGTIVPQALWGPQGQGATKKYVLDATLQWPVFFIREDHTVGLSLQEAVEGPRQALLGAQTRAQLGERSTLHVRIKVRTTRTFSQSLFLLGQGSRSLGISTAYLRSVAVARLRSMEAPTSGARRHPAEESYNSSKIRATGRPLRRRVFTGMFHRASILLMTTYGINSTRSAKGAQLLIPSGGLEEAGYCPTRSLFWGRSTFQVGHGSQYWRSQRCSFNVSIVGLYSSLA